MKKIFIFLYFIGISFLYAGISEKQADMLLEDSQTLTLNQLDERLKSNEEYIKAYNKGVLDAKQKCRPVLLSIGSFTLSIFLNMLGNQIIQSKLNGENPVTIPDGYQRDGYLKGFNDMTLNIRRNVSRISSLPSSLMNGLYADMLIIFILIIPVMLRDMGD